MIKTANKIWSVLMMILLVATVSLSLCGSVMAEETTGEDTSEQGYSSGEIEALRASDFMKSRRISKPKTWRNYQCFTDVQTKEVFCIKSKDMKDNVPAVDAEVYTRGKGLLGGTRRGCKIVSVAWFNNQKCLFCGLLSTAYRASDVITSKSAEVFASSFRALIVIIFAIWLAFKTLNHASFLTSQDAAKYITEVLTQAFKFLLAYFALYYDKAGGVENWYIFKFLIKPIFEAGLDFADAFVGTGMDIDMDFSPSLDRVAENKLYDQSMYEKLESFARDVNMQFSLLQTLGSILGCLGRKYLTLFNAGEDSIQFGLGFNCLIYGMLFWLIGFLLSLAFVFYLFDAVVELGIFGAVLPFALACWPFKMFTKTATNAIKLFMNSTFTFMMAGVAVRVCLELISHSLGTTNSGGNTGINALVQAVDTLDVNAMKELLAVISIGFLIFAFAGFSGFLMVGKVSELTNKFAGGGLSPTASGVATMGASAVTGAIKKVGKPMQDAIGKKYEAGAKKLVSKAVNSKVGKFAAKATAASAAIGLGGPVGAAIVGIAAGKKIAGAVRRRRRSP